MNDQAEDDDDLEESLKHRERFFELVGRCIVRYQSVEDFLPQVFCAALGGDEERASAIFSVVANRGLDTKIKAISAALFGLDESIVAPWRDLSGRVIAAAEARNEMAHGNSVSAGTTVIITVDKSGKPLRVSSVGKTRTELHKTKGAKKSVWTLEKLVEEEEKIWRLIRNLIAYQKFLRGEKVPPHLLEC
ncbi:MAG: hypothetical protein ACR652_07655 [Methylocystis sp.]|uniref:hypothetical protein n=1 Tax=Methylocystis sp. TaxID=1911079 RepID=UPI003DA63C98